MSLKSVLLSTCIALSLIGCSSKQAAQLGLGGGTVAKYPQYMSNAEICETYLYGRATTQTKVALASEWNKRKLNRKYCDKKYNEYYATKFAKWVTGIKSEQDAVDAAATVLPAVID
ncbi:TPA: hypothetical protein ACX6PX_001648 [Photobacterium damselae]